jgi:hypothetical protein
MARNVYFTQGTKSEQYLLEDLIVESLKIYGQDVFYIPRVLVNKDIVFGEDVLSKFEAAYQIEMYFEDVDDFQGQGTFLQKFGIEIEKSERINSRIESLDQHQVNQESELYQIFVEHINKMKEDMR